MLMWIAGMGAAACLVYYIVITIYAGFTVSFSWFWLLAAAGLALIGWASRYSRLHPGKIPMWVSVPAVTALAAAAVVFLAVELCVFFGATAEEEPGLDYVIVLGAKVHKQGISNSLRKRLDKVLEYSSGSPGTIFILSGGQGPDEPVTEAQAMYDYLVERGMSQSRLIMEPLATSTVENIAYGKLIIDRLEQEKTPKADGRNTDAAPGPYLPVEAKPVRIGLLTSNYHVFRAVMIARKRGITDICGIASSSDLLLFVHLCVRECAAILKDRLMGNM